jgi:ATP-dependent RNA helicase DHX37/DHR1
LFCCDADGASGTESESGTEKDTDDYSDDTTSDEDSEAEESNVAAEAMEDNPAPEGKAGVEAEIDATMTTSTPSAANGASVQAEGKKARRPPVPMAEREKAVYVNVVRDPEIQAARMNLPIIGEEQVGGVLHPAWVRGLLGEGGLRVPK